MEMRLPLLLSLLLLHPSRCMRRELLVGGLEPKASLQRKKMVAAAPLPPVGRTPQRELPRPTPLTKTRMGLWW